MNKENLKCEIVCDLLPLYLDQKTGSESNCLVQQHISECAQCREVFQLMNGEVWQNISQTNFSQNIKIGKRIKQFIKRHRIYFFLGIVIGLYAVVLIASVWFVAMSVMGGAL